MRLIRSYLLAAVATAVVMGVTAPGWAGTPADGMPKPGRGRVTEPLREEHRELLPHIEALASTADAIGTAPLNEQIREVDAAYTFLRDRLIPHAVAEDEVMYRRVDALIGSRGRTRATDTMRRDHAEVSTLTDQLGRLRTQLRNGALGPARQRELRRVLCSLNAIVGLHFTKEEEVYLPLLDRELTAAQARDMFRRMEEITQKAAAGSRGGH